jgi:hypothetical protein
MAKKKAKREQLMVAVSRATVLHDHRPRRAAVRFRPATPQEARALRRCECR